MSGWRGKKITTTGFQSHEQTYRARILQNLLRFTLVTNLLFLTIVVLSHMPAVIIGITGGFVVILLINLIILKTGWLNLAALVYFLTVWSGLTLIIAGLHGSLNSPGIGTYLFIIVASGLMLGIRFGYLFAGMSLLAVYGLYWAGEAHTLFRLVPSLSSLRSLVFHTLNIGLAAILVHIIVRNIQRFSETTQIKKSELEEARASLEQRIMERTAEILRQKQFYEALVKNSPIAIVSLDSEHKIVSFNPAFEALFGYPPEELKQRELDGLIVPDCQREQAEEYTRQVLRGNTIHKIGHRRRKDGRLVEVEIYGVPVLVEGHQVGVLALYSDISERKQAEERLSTAKEHAEQLYRVVPSAIFTVNCHGLITSLNAKAAEITGYTPDEIIGKPCTTFSSLPCSMPCVLFSNGNSKQILSRECTIRTKSGEFRTVIKNAELLHDARGNITGGIESFEDITDRKRAEEHLQYLATHDPLTDLPNRVLFYDRLNHALLLARRDQSQIGVFFIDLDGFKSVNDRFGHEQGDVLLQAVAARLKNLLRDCDTIARLGGDEFAFVFENIQSANDAARIAEKLLAALVEPFVLGGHSFTIGASVGISLFPGDGDSSDSLLRNADAAMYHVKERGKNHYHFFGALRHPDAARENT